ncbi:MAG: hypothetical protein HOE90_08755 [Bacteriovoracaceae bacterium]|nr:hypothetical protein [Bacteriovoracaceae bacterium]
MDNPSQKLDLSLITPDDYIVRGEIVEIRDDVYPMEIKIDFVVDNRHQPGIYAGYANKHQYAEPISLVDLEHEAAPYVKDDLSEVCTD